MFGGWLVVLPLLVAFDRVTLQPLIKQSHVRYARQSDLGECCPCTAAGNKDNHGLTDNSMSPTVDCPCWPGDAEASPSILHPALRAIQPFVRQADESLEPKPLLQPEVGLASSVLETLKKATDEEYQEALARDAARSAAKLIESDLSILGDSATESPKNIVRIFLNANNDDMDDNLPEPSHVQETRCVHPTYENIPTIAKLKMKAPKLQRKSVYKNQQDLDSGTGASNIQERVLQPNARNSFEKDIPNHIISGLFPRDNLDEGKGLDKFFTDSPFANIVNPKSNFKLKNLAETLGIASNKEKRILPTIDLKKYFATSTKLPPLKFKPLEKSVFLNNRPLKIKDLLKLKDVELVPRHDFVKNVFDDEKKEPDNKMLKSQISVHFDNKKQKHSHDEDYDTNIAPSVNREITTICKPTSIERIDTVTSPTNPSGDLENSKSSVSNHDDNDIGHTSAPLNSNTNIFSSKSVNSESRESFDYGDPESKEKVNSNESLMNSMSQPEDFIDKCLSQQLPNEEIKKQELEKEVHKYDSNENSEQNLYRIEELEELDLPIEYDNSSTFPELDLTSTSNVQNSQERLNDPIAAANYADFKIKKENVEDPNISRLSTDNMIGNVESDEELFQPTGCVVDISNENVIQDKETVKDQIIKVKGDRPTDKNILTKKQKTKASRQKQPGVAQSILGINNGKFSNSNEDIGQISFQTLQNMSNSILKLSEGETLDDASDNLETGFNETLADDIQNENNFDELNIKDKVNLIEKGETNEILGQNPNEDSCKTIVDMTKMNDINKSETDILDKDSFSKQSAMVAEASIPNTAFVEYLDSKSGQPKTSLSPNAMDNIFLNVVTEPTADISSTLPLTHLPVMKHSNILNNLKSKFENLFTTTKTLSKNAELPNLEDSINESSNNKPIIAKLDGVKTLTKSQQPAHKPLEALASKLPRLTLNPYKNKLAAPKSLDSVINLDPALNSRLRFIEPSTERSSIQKGNNAQASQYKKQQRLRNPENVMNLDKFGSTLSDHDPDLNSPLQLAKPFENAFDPSSALTTFSNSIRSHAESALQNVKETFESHLKQPHFLDHFRQSDTQDILDLTKRRDELNQKLQAIHTDINDRFKTFQQSILNQFNLPSLGDSAFQDDSSNAGLRSSYYPLSKESSFKEASKPQKVINKQIPKNLPKPSIITEDWRAERKYKSPKLTELLSQSKHLDLDKLKHDLKQNTMNKQGILLEKNKFPTFKHNILPTINADKKSSHIDPVKILNTSLPNLRKSIIPILSEKNAMKNKSLFTKPGHIGKFLKEPGTASSHTLPSTINILEKASAEEPISFEENLPTDFTVNKLRKPSLQGTTDMISKNNLKVPLKHLPGKSMTTETDSNTTKKGLLSRMRDGKSRQYIKDSESVLAKSQEDEMSISFKDATQSAAQNSERVRLVEPLRENVPYKCKLICYKDV